MVVVMNTASYRWLWCDRCSCWW